MSRATLSFLLSALIAGLAQPASAATRRLAVLVGNNAGSGDRPSLRWAETDAAKLARVLVEVGEVDSEDVALRLGGSVADLEGALAQVKERLAVARRTSDARLLLYFYFSGHSDGESLELGRERYPIARLKARLAEVGADVRLTILDACRSGAAIASKGGSKAPPFEIRMADSLVSTGEVLLASSAADELALESPEVRGSYFTHFFVSGIRGAADSSGDGLITLQEAYRFAYDRTVAASSATLQPPQHPTYDFRLSGQGELVLAALTARTAGLVLPPGFERALVLDLARDQVVAEIPVGASPRVALPPGRYAVRALRKGEWWGGRIAVEPGPAREVDWASLAPLPTPEVAARGGAPLPAALPSASGTPAEPWRARLAIAAGGAMASTSDADAIAFGRLAVHVGRAWSVGAALVAGGGPGALAGHEYAGQLRLGAQREVPLGLVSLLAGLEAGGGAIHHGSQGQAELDWVGVAALRLGLRLNLGERVGIEIVGEGSATIDDSYLPTPAGGATLGVAIAL